MIYLPNQLRNFECIDKKGRPYISNISVLNIETLFLTNSHVSNEGHSNYSLDDMHRIIAE